MPVEVAEADQPRPPAPGHGADALPRDPERARLISHIVAANPTASPVFLAQFDTHALRAYLAKITSLQSPYSK